MRRAAAAWRRLLLCQKLGGPPSPLTSYALYVNYKQLNLLSSYSSVPNRRVGPNNCVGWIFFSKLISLQDQISSCRLDFSWKINKCVGRNNPVGWIFHGKLINVQGEIILQGEIFNKKSVGWNKHVGEIFNNRVDKEGSRMERTLDFDSFDLGVNF